MQSLDVTDLIGVPYIQNGRTKDGFDCYGLAIEVEKRFGNELIDVVYENNNIKLSDEFAPLLNIKKTDFIHGGTLLEIHIKNELHIGVAINKREFIHATTNQGVIISPIGAYKIYAAYEVI